MHPKMITAPGLPVLLHRYCIGKSDYPIAYVGHSQPTHSGYFIPFCKKLNAEGWGVAAGDLRGHGGSVGSKVPRAHLDATHGWEDWIADFRCHLDHAFRDADWERRVIIAPNVSALLTLECLKREPELAKTIVLMSPPPNQPALSKLGLAYVRARSFLHAYDKPDEQMLHNFYSFLGAHLKERRHLADVISRDSVLVERIVSDPTAWTTPTLGYWSQIYSGAKTAWQKPRSLKLPNAMRVLVLHGEEDAMLRDGGLIAPIVQWFRDLGVHSCAVARIEGGRHGFYLDGCMTAAVEKITQFVHSPSDEGHQTYDEVSTELSVTDVTRDVFTKLGISFSDDPLSAEELVEICYDAVNDETRWVEVLYRFLLIAVSEGDCENTKIDVVIERLMPHLQRAFHLSRQIASQATMGVVLQELVERLQICTAIVNDKLEVLSANTLFHNAVQRLMCLQQAPTAEQINWLIGDAVRPLEQGKREAVLVLDGMPIGVLIKPEAFAQTALRRGGPSGLVVLRLAEDEAFRAGVRAELLEVAFGLTRHEAMVAIAISRGASPEDVARDLSLSINTVRTHLKRCYVKMGVRGQNGLTSRLLSGPLGWLNGMVERPLQ